MWIYHCVWYVLLLPACRAAPEAIFFDRLHNPTFSELVLVNTLNTDSYKKLLATFNTSDEQSWLIESFELTQELVICLRSPHSEKCQILDMRHQFLVTQQRLAFLSIARRTRNENNGLISLYINCRPIVQMPMRDWMDGLFQMHRQAVPHSGSLMYFDVPVLKVMKNFGCVYLKSIPHVSPPPVESSGYSSYLQKIKDAVVRVEQRLSTLVKRFDKLFDAKSVAQVLDVSAAAGAQSLDSSLELGTPCQLSIGPYMQFMSRCAFRQDAYGGTKRWTVIMHRSSVGENGSVNFDRPWDEYKNGFGNLNDDFWLGLDHIHELTRLKKSRLRLEAQVDANRTDVLEFARFYVASEKEDYVLLVGEIDESTSAGWNRSGESNGSLIYHNGMKFTTKDRDNDMSSGNCARLAGGGWWFRNCATFLPTGKSYAFWMADDRGEQSFYNSVTLLVD